MLKALFVIAAAAVVAIAAVFVYAAYQPDEFRVTRSAVIKAPADKIYPLIDDFRAWRDWSPFEKMDPEMKRIFAGAEKGKGAVYEWDGKGQAGAGRMEIVSASSPSDVVIALDFSKPMRASNIVEFALKPEGDGTRVTWDMSGQTPLIGKVMHLFFDMDKMVGGAFDEGLAALKAKTESAAAGR